MLLLVISSVESLVSFSPLSGGVVSVVVTTSGGSVVTFSAVISHMESVLLAQDCISHDPVMMDMEDE